MVSAMFGSRACDFLLATATARKMAVDSSGIQIVHERSTMLTFRMESCAVAIAAAEIVERKPHARGAELMQGRKRRLAVLQHTSYVISSSRRCGAKADATSTAVNRRCEVGILELDRDRLTATPISSGQVASADSRRGTCWSMATIRSFVGQRKEADGLDQTALARDRHWIAEGRSDTSAQKRRQP